MRILIALTFFIIGPHCYGQLSDALNLKSNLQYPAENIDDFIETAELSHTDIVDGRYYKLLQFHQIPSSSEIKAIEKTGIRLLDYIPNKAYLVSIPQEFDPIRLKSINSRYIKDLDLSYKLDEQLHESDFPEWAKIGQDQVQVLIHYPSDLVQAKVLELSKYAGITPVSFNGINTCFTANVPINRLESIAALPYILHVEMRPPPSTPDDTPGRSIIRANMIDSPSPMGRKYDGTGIAVLCRDDGAVFNHVDFHGRLFQEFSGNSRGSHGDGVSGIMAGAGNKDPRNRGMAAGSDLWVIDYQADFLDNTMALHLDENVLVTNSSYSNGCNAGYTGITRIVDGQCYDNPTLMHVFSAGNSNNQECGYGAGDQWGNITGGHKQGKNVLTVANITNRGAIVESSSRGPAHDGRIKPDIASNGVSHQSTDNFHSYQSFGGTSGAAPGIAGVLAMLHHAYKVNYNEVTADAALLKAIMLNTADDLGNKGPDFIFGWGAANAFRAALAIEDNNFLTDNIDQNEDKTHVINIPPGARELRIMTYWKDPAASFNADKALINDINTTVTGPDGLLHLPWVLRSLPFAEVLELPAERGNDDLNNMEQIFIENPESGDYSLNVNGHIIPEGIHEYIVTWEYRLDEITFVFPYGGEKIKAGGRETLYWESTSNGNPYLLEFSKDGGTTWTEIETAGPTAQSVIYSIPNVTTNQAHIRITRNGISTVSEAFTIAPIPRNVQILEVCADKMVVSWTAVDDAISYDVYTLGKKYMEIEVNTTETTVEYPISNPYQEHWVAVSANFDNDIRGERSIAKNHDGNGLLNCLLDYDAILSKIDNPDAEHFINCSGTLEEFITVELINSGVNDLNNVSVAYQLGDNPVVEEMLDQSLLTADTISYTFKQPINLTDNGDFNIKTWLSQDDQALKINDTLNISGPVYLARGEVLPLEEDFDSRIIPEFWRIENPDEFVSWTTLNVVQKNGRRGGTLTMAFEDYSSSDNSDYLNLIPLDLSEATATTILSFDLAYFNNNIDLDGLLVEVSTDCGATFQDTIYEKYGPDLATTFKYFYEPEEAGHWGSEELDLSQYNGLSKVLIRFNGVNQSGSNLYIDNINISENTLTAAVADFTLTRTRICPLEPTLVSHSSEGGLLEYSWDFGFSALPGTSNKSGPHEVSYLLPGIKTITLTVTNALGTSTIEKEIEVLDSPKGGWSHEVMGNGAVQFSSNTSNTSFIFWDFGDGNFSSLDNPLHRYESSGEYEVTLTLTNLCKEEKLSSTITIIISDTDELEKKLDATISPNPNTGDFDLNLEGTVGLLDVNLLDLNGRTVDKRQINLSGSAKKLQYSNTQLEPGLYFIRLANDLGSKTLKMVIVGN